MSVVKDIKNEIENVYSEMKWLKTRITEANDNCECEDVDFGAVNSQYEDVENAIYNLVSSVEKMTEAIEELI